MVESEGCANVCFALDGSASAIVDPESCKLSALVYGRNVTLISPLTEDISSFAKAVNSALSDMSSATSIRDGILQCVAQLNVRDGRRAVIVLMGDGRDNSGSDPIRLARDFKRTFVKGSALHTVGVDSFDSEILENIASAGCGKKLDVTSFSDTITLAFNILDGGDEC
ncbi:von Willebrand factor A-like protein [Gracilaria domingensis]|nr:von Willebrand factor A-like protein [Gracilaria domingensis]